MKKIQHDKIHASVGKSGRYQNIAQLRLDRRTRVYPPYCRTARDAVRIPESCSPVCTARDQLPTTSTDSARRAARVSPPKMRANSVFHLANSTRHVDIYI